MAYEKNGVGNNIAADIHDTYLTDLIKAIRKDLKIKDEDFPLVGFKRAQK
ncbi:MAG: hypothetical protein JST50_14910 [Bacteroidetes bacterium]|nr:hypothetical protein [Bacteroidota bacterium]